MCELFGVSAEKSFIVNEYLNAFFHHSQEHKHGWGLAVFHGLGASLEKEAAKAEDSAYLKQRLSRNVEAANLLAHIRYATIGQIEYANCHPFIWDDDSGRAWTMIHNGTLFHGEKLSPFRDLQEGTTDSERLLLYFVDRMNQALKGTDQPLQEEERFRLLDEALVEIAWDNKLNFILYDGEIMYVHTNCEGTLHRKGMPGRTIFATTPLLTGGWEPFPKNRLIAYRKGSVLFEGTDHGQDFHEDDHDMTSLLSAFAQL